MLGLRNASKLDTATSTAEVVFGTPLRMLGMCFQSEQFPRRTAQEQLQLARANVAAFSPETLDLWKFRTSPFVAKALGTPSFVYIRDDRLAKPTLAPRYTGPYKVVKKCWDSNTFRVDLGGKEDSVALERLKAADIPEEASWL